MEDILNIFLYSKSVHIYGVYAVLNKIVERIFDSVTTAKVL